MTKLQGEAVATFINDMEWALSAIKMRQRVEEISVGQYLHYQEQEKKFWRAAGFCVFAALMK
jgi:hypothetical protein